MNIGDNTRKEIDENGFAIINNVYTDEEIDNILLEISNSDTAKPAFRKMNDLFAIRRFLKEIPSTGDIVFNNNLNRCIPTLFGDDFFVVKSIYFDKPEVSNWFVSYHQDLTISVDKKIPVAGFGPWTTKQYQFAVQPPLNILQDNFTIRIHLDNATEKNGALKVIPKSHLKGIYRPETIDWAIESEITCNVEKGGIMLMKPLLLHSSGRTTNNNKRRVIHIEFSRSLLPDNLNWAEFVPIRICQ